MFTNGTIVHNYVNTWILGIEDVTELAHAVKATVDKKQKQMPQVPQECLYEVNQGIAKTLRGCLKSIVINIKTSQT
ncbi:MAG: DUF4291 family protein [Calothrix sp. MO_167.B12]|nr:DUF4291 family protein [Calothrix sp. MO_167.B12]